MNTERALTIGAMNKPTLIIATLLVAVFCLGFADLALAAPTTTGKTIGSLAESVTGSLRNLAKLITAIAYIAGLGFAVGAILKFKQHKDNPTQIPIGTPVALLFVAAALIFLPMIFGMVGETLFGSGATTGGPSGYVFE